MKKTRVHLPTRQRGFLKIVKKYYLLIKILTILPNVSYDHMIKVELIFTLNVFIHPNDKLRGS